MIVLCGCVCAVISFGPRASLGFFLTPQSQANEWGRDVFGLAIAIQNIVWGLGQPFAGMLADRFGVVRVLWGGAIIYTIGLAMMAYATTPMMLNLSAGVFIGFGLAGCGFSVVLSAFGKLLPERMRSLAFGAGAAAGSFGQFLYSPLAVSLIDSHRLAGDAADLRGDDAAHPAVFDGARDRREETRRKVLERSRCGRHCRKRCCTGPTCCWCSAIFTCGFQLAFVTIHLPPYLVDKGLTHAGRRLDASR